MVEIFLGVILFFCGMVIGRLATNQPFIEIKVNNSPDAPEEYNESLADELDPEIRSYYDNNNGLNKF